MSSFAANDPIFGDPDIDIDAPAPTIEACTKCDDDATGTVGAVALCDLHLDEVLDPIRKRVFKQEGFDGIGIPTAPRPDWGPLFHDLECSECAATFVGKRKTPCPWCAGLHERSVAEQRVILLRPDLPASHDKHHDTAVKAWAQRLAMSVTAGIVTERDARWALDRMVIANAA